MHTTQALADWAIGLGIEQFPAPALELAKSSVLDAIGCAFVSLAEECVEGVLAAVAEQGGAPQATVVGAGRKLSATGAALANSTLLRALDMNDHLAHDPNDGSKLGGHPSDMLGALLAVGEWKQKSGRDVLAAMLCAYEVYGRVYSMLGAALPWDHATAFGISTPAAAARLLGLGANETAHAIALGASQAATLGGVRRGQLSHAKFLAGPWACERGLYAALMASHGVTGPLSIFEDSRGFDIGVARSSTVRARLLAPLGPRAMIEGITIKAFPGMDTTQAAEEAATTVVTRLGCNAGGLSAADIARVEMLVNDHPMTIAQTSDPERRAPQSRETADHSFQYLVAVGLLDGEVTPRQFAPGRWVDPAVVDLMARIDVRPSAELTRHVPGGFPCTLSVTLKDGRSATAEVGYAKGHARNPMTPEEVEAKFRRMTSPALSESRASAIIAMVHRLDTLADVGELAALLGKPVS